MKKDRGFIGKLLMVIIALALLKYLFNWSIFDAANSEQGKATISYIRDVLNIAWTYVRTPTLFIWQKILDYLPSRS